MSSRSTWSPVEKSKNFIFTTLLWAGPAQNPPLKWVEDGSLSIIFWSICSIDIWSLVPGENNITFFTFSVWLSPEKSVGNWELSGSKLGLPCLDFDWRIKDDLIGFMVVDTMLQISQLHLLSFGCKRAVYTLSTSGL